MIKKGVFVLFFVLIFSFYSINSISSLGNCEIKLKSEGCPSSGNNNKILLGLTSETNSHVNSDTSNSQYILCCPFSSSSCNQDNSNKIIKLFSFGSATQNTHAEIPDKNPSIYTYTFCGGDVSNCGSTSGSCSQGEYGVLSLTSETNAHVGKFSDYPIKICCTYSGELNERYWTDNNLQTISQSSKGATVKLVWKNIPSGTTTESTFKILKDNLLIDTEIKENLAGIITTFEGSPSLVATWIISEDDFSKIKSGGKVYFEVGGEKSGLLEISTSSNSNPTAIISSPISGDCYNSNNQVSFDASLSNDPDDEITSYLWKIGTETSSQDKFDKLFNIQNNFEQKNILLTVSSGIGERLKSDSKQIGIILMKSPGKIVFSNISSPSYGRFFDNENVLFDSEGSYAKDCTGICTGCFDKTLDYNWTIYLNGQSTGIPFGDGNSFTRSVPVGTHKIKLTVNSDELFSYTESLFTVRFGSSNKYCSLDGKNWEDSNGNIIEDSLNNCYYEGISCCPEDKPSCEDKDDNGIYSCEFLNSAGCSQYDETSKTECEINGVASESLLNSLLDQNLRCGSSIQVGSSSCYSLTNCLCKWDSSTSKCKESFENELLGDCSNLESGNCVITTSGDDDCEDGFLSYTITSIWNEETVGSLRNPLKEECEEINNQESTIPCLNNLRVPFIGFFGIFLSIIFIFLVYLKIIEKRK